MIKNAFPKARLGARCALSRRLSMGAASLGRPALISTQHCTTKLNFPLARPAAVQRRFSNIPGRASLDYEYDTIYALSTAPGRAAIAIIRISGGGWQDVRKPSRSHPSELIAYSRSTGAYAQSCLFPHLDVPRCETYMIRPTPPISSTRL
jgi:hypothetical protein